MSNGASILHNIAIWVNLYSIYLSNPFNLIPNERGIGYDRVFSWNESYHPR